MKIDKGHSFFLFFMFFVLLSKGFAFFGNESGPTKWKDSKENDDPKRKMASESRYRLAALIKENVFQNIKKDMMLEARSVFRETHNLLIKESSEIDAKKAGLDFIPIKNDDDLRLRISEYLRYFRLDNKLSKYRKPNSSANIQLLKKHPDIKNLLTNGPGELDFQQILLFEVLLREKKIHQKKLQLYLRP